MVNLVVKAIQVNITESLHRITRPAPVHSLTSVSVAESLSLPPPLSQTPQTNPLTAFLSLCSSISNWVMCSANPDWCYTGPCGRRLDICWLTTFTFKPHPTGYFTHSRCLCFCFCWAVWIGLEMTAEMRHGSICSATAAWLYAETIKIQHLLS